MVEFSRTISHRLERAQVLRAWRAGRKKREALQDADFLLLAAAQHHGSPVDQPCPMCEKQTLRVLLWVYGEELGRKSGSARSLEEITQYASEGRTFSVHTVEVCSTCKWNHLLEEATAMPSA